jgi:hypothetical protein
MAAPSVEHDAPVLVRRRSSSLGERVKEAVGGFTTGAGLYSNGLPVHKAVARRFSAMFTTPAVHELDALAVTGTLMKLDPAVTMMHKIRDAPSTKGTPIATITPEIEVRVTATDGDWLKVESTALAGVAEFGWSLHHSGGDVYYVHAAVEAELVSNPAAGGGAAAGGGLVAQQGAVI